jgi:hypothetical protein
MSILLNVATFYWQLTAVINQDIPPSSDGKPLEFCRYVGYFLDKYPEFKKVPCLMPLATSVYLEAIEAGQEPRLMIRKASYRASITHRRLNFIADGATVTLAFPDGQEEYPLKDILAAILLEHGEHLLRHYFSHRTQFVSLFVSGGVPDSWLHQLESYIHSPDSGIQELRRETEALVRPEPQSIHARLVDRGEAIAEGTTRFFARFTEDPKAALKHSYRELKSAPRLLPTWIYFAGIVPLFAWVLIEAALMVKNPVDALISLGAVLSGLWVADAVSYVIHMDRDGWGNSIETRAFQDHHNFPSEAGHWTIRRSIGTVAHGVFLLMFILVLADLAPMLQLAIGIMFWSFLFVTWTHRWAHTPKHEIPKWIRLMQKYRVIISPEFHAIHHTSLSSSWGIFNGWSCIAFDSIRFHELHTRVRSWLFGEARPLWETQIAERAALKVRSAP